MCAAIVVAFAVMVVVECVLCNMPFWRSLAASGDSAAAYNVLGPGLERTDEGLLKVTDPTQAYMQVDADGSSEYVRMDPVSSKALDKAARQSEQVLRTVRVRPDVNRRAGTVSSVSVSSPRSLYVHAAAAGGSVCVRIVEPKGSLIPFDAVRANVRVPFALNPLRIGVMAAVLAIHSRENGAGTFFPPEPAYAAWTDADAAADTKTADAEAKPKADETAVTSRPDGRPTLRVVK